MKSRKITDHVTMLQLGSRGEWLKQRKKGIGGSDAAAIVGMNPYKTNVELWLEKTGQMEPVDISDKPYVRYGTEAEDHLRALFGLDYPEYKVGYVPDNMFTNNQLPWAHASLDGWLMDADGRMGILEIKTTNILQSMAKEKWKNRIPGNYYCQVLHYLGVTGFDFVVLKAQLKYEYSSGEIVLHTRHYKIERTDVEDDIKFLMQKEREFWKHVTTMKKPALVLPEI